MATACRLTSNEDAEDDVLSQGSNDTDQTDVSSPWQVRGGVGLKALRKRCKSFFVHGKKKEAKLGKSTKISVRDRRSRLAEDALFHDDMLEVAHLYGNLLEQPDQTALLSRSPPSLGARPKLGFSSPGISPSMGCVSIKCTQNLTEDLKEHHLFTATVGHSQIGFSNFLIPGQNEIVNCPFYWGEIDRYEAEKLLSDKPDGSFLLRDSAQDDFLFSVSFRRYSRSLHARIEECNHMFSFDGQDSGVHATLSVRKLLEHYKDPMICMFFEPMLLSPVLRKSCFSLQSLARATICDSTTYSGVLRLPLPTVLKQYLREYHYKHKVCLSCLEETDRCLKNCLSIVIQRLE